MIETNHPQLNRPPHPEGRGRGWVSTIGFFDGVHRGHQCLIQQVRDEALRHGARSLLITFDRHPRTVFSPTDAPQLLTTAEEKMALLQDAGVDEIYVLPFDKEMAALTAREFMQKVLKEQLGVDALVIGYDHRFGRRVASSASEGFEDYRAYGQELGIEVLLAHELEGEHVSSSAIRKALNVGKVELAASLLGRPYEWTGRVVHGHEVGRLLGFPTANLQGLLPEKVLPARGAYAVRVRISDSEGSAGLPSKGGQLVERGMLNIGQRPTLDNGSDTSVEVHLLDFQGNLYGKTLTLSFIARLREEQRFDSEQELMEQLQRDRDEARAKLS